MYTNIKKNKGRTKSGDTSLPGKPEQEVDLFICLFLFYVARTPSLARRRLRVDRCNTKITEQQSIHYLWPFITCCLFVVLPQLEVNDLGKEEWEVKSVWKGEG